MDFQVPLVSVSIIVLNGQRTIRSLLESLQKLSKDSPAYEIIIVDNGSTDGTQDIIREYKNIKLFEETQKGIPYARNALIHHAKGQYIAFTDSDCVVTEDWLIEGLKPFSDPNVGIVAGKILGTEPKTIVQEWMNARKMLDQEHVLKNTFMPSVHTANAFFYREDIIKVGGFDDELFSSEDADICWKIE
jgi:glycosyltransferase involved in cell wall biosynthesis